MIAKLYTQPVTVILMISLIAWQGQALAFYESQGEQVSTDARGLIRGLASTYRYSDDSTPYPGRTPSGMAGIARLMADGAIGEPWGFEFNAYQTYIPRALLATQGSAGLPLSVERSAVLEWSFSDSNYTHLAIDRLALRWSNHGLDLTIGRQAINLATTFYFTPNDFFAPFSAQTFYRVYKPGVDGLRAEISLGKFSQLSLMSVLGYKPTPDSDTGWSDHPDSQRASHLLRWSNVYGNVEGILILGRVINKNILGGALQGELFEWLGIRLEGHHARSQADGVEDYDQLSLGLEHRWENSLELRLEWFYNGLGANSVSRYQAVQDTEAGQYLARRYSALGGRYQITSLLIGEAVIISNLTDHSHLVSLNTIFSLSDESEMATSLNIPYGNAPASGEIKSEFGAYPASINLEFRSYF